MRKQHTLCALVIRPSDRAIFTVEGNRLPAKEIEAANSWMLDAGNKLVQQAMLDMFGVAPVVLRRYEQERDEARTQTTIVYELDYFEPAVTGRWRPAAELAHPPHRAIAERAAANLNAPPTRAPWMSRGWHASAEAWITQQLTQHGYTVTNIEPHRSWCISYLARILTTSGERFFFKASIDLPLFANEGAVTAYLHGQFPRVVPRPIAVDVARHWFILADFGKPIDNHKQLDLPTRLAVIERVVEMQRASAAKIDDLLANGCVDRRLPLLMSELEGWEAEDAPVYRGLSAEEAARLRAALPTLRESCQTLIDSPLPTTLIHGDLHEGNLHLDGNDLTIFDWSDAAVGFPWVDQFLIFDAPDEKREQVTAAYLKLWEGVASAEQLQRFWQFWQPLFYFYHAVSYVSIFDHIDPTTAWELGGDASGYVRGGLKYL